MSLNTLIFVNSKSMEASLNKIQDDYKKNCDIKKAENQEGQLLMRLLFSLGCNKAADMVELQKAAKYFLENRRYYFIKGSEI